MCQRGVADPLFKATSSRGLDGSRELFDLGSASMQFANWGV